MSNPQNEAFSERPLHPTSESFSERPLGHGHDSHGGTDVFSDADTHHFHAQDLYAAKVVVCLMVGIFCVGVVLYSIVAWACAT